MSSEANERLLRGPKGEQGERGIPGMPRAARRGFVYLAVLTLLLAAFNLLWTSRQVGAASAKTQAQCRFDADIGTAPVALNPKTGQPSLLGVTIVSDARIAWHQTACPGQLPSPSPSFRRWAVYFRLPVG
jgi:hypothetical protein